MTEVAHISPCLAMLRTRPRLEPVQRERADHRGVPAVSAGWGISAPRQRQRLGAAGDEHRRSRLQLALHLHT